MRGGRPLCGFGSVGFEIRLLRVSGLAVRKSHFKCLYSLRSDCKSARAAKWDYTMTEDLQQKLQTIMQAYIDAGKLNDAQIQALKN